MVGGAKFIVRLGPAFGKIRTNGAARGAMLPYETTDTILRLDMDLRATGATTVVCLGDSFDDLEAERGLPEMKTWLTRLQAGRRWIWIEGNHDPGPVEIAGSHLAELPLPPVVFRHEAKRGQWRNIWSLPPAR